MIRFREGGSGGGGTGDIKSDGSVNFIATEHWRTGAATESEVGLNHILTQDTAKGTQASLSSEGSLILTQGGSSSNFFTFNVLIPTATFQDAFFTPIQLISGLGAGIMIEVITAWAYMPFNTAIYAATTIILYIQNTISPQYTISTVINDNASVSATGDKYPLGPGDKFNMKPNEPLMLTLDANTAGIGDGDVYLRIVYRSMRRV